jgi:hypothetical protein
MKANASKGSLYICFVDFSKTFNPIFLKLFWERLGILWVHGNMMKAIRPCIRMSGHVWKLTEG